MSSFQANLPLIEDQPGMSEHYDCMEVEDVEDPLSTFKSKYDVLKIELRHLCDGLILFDYDFPMKEADIAAFLTIDPIMELCRIFHDYFLCHDTAIYTSAEHITNKMVITDDSPKEDVMMYIQAYIFMSIETEPHKHQDLFDMIIDVSQYYEKYFKNDPCAIFSMIQLEESLENMGL